VQYFISYGIYNIYFHPLSRFPGSKLWATTRFTYLLSLWSRNLATEVRNLHQQYGDVIRIAPDEISFARSDAWHDIYSNAPPTPRSLKASLAWYHAWLTNVRFECSGPAGSCPVSKSYGCCIYRTSCAGAGTNRPSIRFLAYVALQKLVSAEDSSAVVNVVRWYGFVAFDLIGDLAFGESFDCLQRTEFHPWVSMIFNSLRAAIYRASLRYYPGLDWILRFAIPKSGMKKQVEHWNLAGGQGEQTTQYRERQARHNFSHQAG